MYLQYVLIKAFFNRAVLLKLHLFHIFAQCDKTRNDVKCLQIVFFFMLAHLADINERDFRQPACQKKSLACWFSGITKQYSGVLGRLQNHGRGRGVPTESYKYCGLFVFCKSACSYQKCNYVDLKGGFESLHIIFKTFSYHMGIK